MKIVAEDGLLENLTNCFEPETIVAQLDNKIDVAKAIIKIDFFIFKKFDLMLIFILFVIDIEVIQQHYLDKNRIQFSYDNTNSINLVFFSQLLLLC